MAEAMKKASPALFTQTFACLSGRHARVLLMHGWGFDSAIWQDVVEPLQQLGEVVLVDLPGFGGSEEVICDYSDDALLDLLSPLLSHETYLVGWSLGGNIATLLAKNFPHSVRGLMCLATNPCFVSQGAWPGMEPLTLKAFISGFSSNPDKTLQQFVGLTAMGDSEKRAVMLRCKALSAKRFNTTMLQALRYLSRVDQRSDLQALTIPTHFIFAEADVLVPNAVAIKLDAVGVVCDMMPRMSHAIPLNKEWTFVAAMRAMVDSYGHPTDKHAIAAAFGQAAATYDSAATLQQYVATETLTMLGEAKVEVLVDLGCGTGYCVPNLMRMAQHLVAMDISTAMLAQLSRGQCLAVAGDAEQIPLANNSVDVVFSSLAIQWCQQPAKLFAEIARVLKPGGRFLFSTLGPASLGELRAAWWSVDRDVHVNGFAPWATLQQHFGDLKVTHHREEVQVLNYTSVLELMRDLKHIGATSIDERRAGLRGASILKQLQKAYERFRMASGKLPASYVVHYVELQK